MIVFCRKGTCVHDILIPWYSCAGHLLMEMTVAVETRIENCATYAALCMASFAMSCS